jgi:hypothetical protein
MNKVFKKWETSVTKMLCWLKLFKSRLGFSSSESHNSQTLKTPSPKQFVMTPSNSNTATITTIKSIKFIEKSHAQQK